MLLMQNRSGSSSRSGRGGLSLLLVLGLYLSAQVTIDRLGPQVSASSLGDRAVIQTDGLDRHPAFEREDQLVVGV